jgi:hypothetical protein
MIFLDKSYKTCSCGMTVGVELLEAAVVTTVADMKSDIVNVPPKTLVSVVRHLNKSQMDAIEKSTTIEDDDKKKIKEARVAYHQNLLASASTPADVRKTLKKIGDEIGDIDIDKVLARQAIVNGLSDGQLKILRDKNSTKRDKIQEARLKPLDRAATARSAVAVKTALSKLFPDEIADAPMNILETREVAENLSLKHLQAIRDNTDRRNRNILRGFVTAKHPVGATTEIRKWLDNDGQDF